ncbi:hypothetical protein ACET3Z_030173 [Daucus carota]
MCKCGDESVYGEFVARVSDRVSSGSLAWSRRQVFMLHCLGVLLDHQKNNPCNNIKDKESLALNLVSGLQLPSEEIRGEILFVLYKILIIQNTFKDDNVTDAFITCGPKLLRLSLEALMKTESDDVRLNCIALLSVLAQRGFFDSAYGTDISSGDQYEDDNFMETNQLSDRSAMTRLFAEAIKAPLLSSDSQVQTATLNLTYLYLSRDDGSGKEVHVLVEENIADYVFEILRLSGCKDTLVNTCLQVLDLLSSADQVFKPRLAIGFSTLLPVLHYVADVPFHPVQPQTIKLILKCVSNCPGILSNCHVEEISLVLAGMLKKHIDGDTGMLPETFTLACSLLVALLKSPSCHEASTFALTLQDASRHAILNCLSIYGRHPSQFLHSLYLLKEAYAYGCERNTNTSYMELRNCILEVCKTHLLPWFLTAISDMEEDMVLGVLESFHAILLQDIDTKPKDFAYILLSSSWFSFSFGCLGLFPAERMKWRVHLMSSSLVDVLLGNDSGQPIRDAASHLPSDPIEMLYILGQKSSHNLDSLSCQSAILLILYTSSLYDDRLADDKLVLASLEQYILLNNIELLYGAAKSETIEILVNVYGLYRSLAKMSYQIPYSPEAERILFHLASEKDWDLLSSRIHFKSLKWLFQQEKMCKLLSTQILKLCRCSTSVANHILLHGKNSQSLDVLTLAELVASEDNFSATLLVYLLRELVEEGGQEDDIISTLNLIAEIIDTCPGASDQLCLHGIGIAIENLYYYSRNASFPNTYMNMLKLIFRIFSSVRSKSISEDESWLAVTMKLMDYLIATATADGWNHEGLMIIGILCLILHHSTNQALLGVSKSILLCSALVQIITKTIREACSKGPALTDHDEGTNVGASLIFLLLLNYFSFKSMHAVVPGNFYLLDLLDTNNVKEIYFISIPCHDLCRLIYFGSPPVKLVASYCLLELLTRISEEERTEPEKFNCNSCYLKSLIAVLEGMLHYSDIRVAMNCSLCLSIILGWQKQDISAQVFGRNNWCRFIIEELVMSLAVPCLASKTLPIHHKPAVHVAVALLKLQNIPQWMSSVFDDSSILGIVKNLSASNLSPEMVLLFRVLLTSGYLKADQVAVLNRLFQECRKRIYSQNSQESKEEHTEKLNIASEGLGNVCEFLINLMSSQSPAGIRSKDVQVRNKDLLEEIELFSKDIMEEDVA